MYRRQSFHTKLIKYFRVKQPFSNDNGYRKNPTKPPQAHPPAASQIIFQIVCSKITGFIPCPSQPQLSSCWLSVTVNTWRFLAISSLARYSS